MNTLISLFSPMEWYAIGLAFLLFLFITIYQLVIYRQPAYSRNKAYLPAPDTWPPVSVILCVTNEYKLLKRILPTLLEQDYPCYEVIVVNDRSQDNSEILLRVLQEQYPHLQVRTTHTDDSFGRAPALALGMAVRAAKYELVLCIEAHSYVKSPHWIRSMAMAYGNRKELVLGHRTHYRCSKWIRCDFLQYALHYMGRAATGRPYTGTGANLLFKKSLFYDNNGLNVRLSREHFPDRVLIGELASRKNCGICVQAAGVTHSRIKLDVKSWNRYRKTEKRSFSLSPKYTKYPMLMESIIRLAFYGLSGACIAVFYPRLELVLIFASLLFLRLLSVLLLYLGVRNILDDKGLAFPFLAWDLMAPFVHIYRAVRL
ncbi:MAG: glycosyltransferase [Bacteroidales bacterium]|nr:glycosyltransferase [Bacteroidales bacterium]MCL2738779.1 glycosyltransferase [Bacteroidales bacterium]